MNNTNISQTLKSLESLYLKNDLDTAILQQKKMKGELDPGHLYYNLGTLYLRKGDLAAGRYYLELSKKNNFNFSMVNHNLQYVKTKLDVKEIGIEDAVMGNIFSVLMEAPAAYYLTLTLILFLISLLIFRIRFFLNKILLIFLLIFSLSPYFFHRFYLSQIKQGICLDVSELHEGPSAVFGKIGSIRPGEKILIGEESNNWLYVTYPKNLNGWVNKNKIGIL